MLPTLFKRTSTGAIQYWTISVEGSTIVTKFGQVGGAEQIARDLIREGKSAGKKNATTPEQQAALEAEALHRKKIERKGYVQDRARAERGETDAEGGIAPMLAHKYAEQSHKIKFPCYMQPKLDGIRCTSDVQPDGVTLWSRTRKQILSMPHIARALSALPVDTLTDGEIYHHDYRDDFEKITELVRPDEPRQGHEIVQLHVYDLPSCEENFGARHEMLKQLIGRLDSPSVVLVETIMVVNPAELLAAFRHYRDLGYEGAIARNDGPYVNKRSYDLQKVVEHIREEFDIVGIEEGRGKLAGHVGAFVCKTADGLIFNVKLEGATERLRELFQNHSLWKDEKLTVEFRNWTKRKVPRFPVGIAVRNYE